MASSKAKLVESLKKKPLRKCLTLHECCLCNQAIAQGQLYHDGGYGRRAHVKCVDPTYSTLFKK